LTDRAHAKVDRCSDLMKATFTIDAHDKHLPRPPARPRITKLRPKWVRRFFSFCSSTTCLLTRSSALRRAHEELTTVANFSMAYSMN
jgi:hypothetical protein